MSGVKRQVDRLGRIVIPISYRKYLNLNENSSVNISLENDSIIITADTECCVLCGSTTQLHGEISLCEGCIKAIKEL